MIINYKCTVEVLRQVGLAHGVMDLFSTSIWRCWYLFRRTKIQRFKSLMITVLLYVCETWTLHTDLKRQNDVFGSKCLRCIMGVSMECQISDCSVRLNQGLLPPYPTNINSGYIGMWHITQKLILLVGLFLKGITWDGEGQGGAHKVRGWGKLMLPVGS